MLTTVVFIAVFSALILIHEWGHFVVARRVGVTVERFSLGFGPRIARWQRGETEYCLSLVPIGGYVKMAGEHAEDARSGAPWEYLSKPIQARAAIIFAGPLLNYLLAWIAFITVYLCGYPAVGPTIGGLLPDKPAARADIRIGDRIRAIDGVPIATWEEVVERVHAHAGRDIHLTLDRAGTVLERAVVSEATEMRDLVGRRRAVGLIGITPQGEIVRLRYGPVRSVIEGTRQLWSLTVLTGHALVGIVTGRLALGESMSGPIGVFVMTGEAAHLGPVYVLHVLAVLSMSLAIFNVLPIPVLDGGHLLFLAVETVRGKPVSLRIQSAATQVGMALLLGLMVVVFYSDVNKFGLTDKVKHLWHSPSTRDAAPVTDTP